MQISTVCLAAGELGRIIALRMGCPALVVHGFLAEHRGKFLTGDLNRLEYYLRAPDRIVRAVQTTQGLPDLVPGIAAIPEHW